MLRRLSRVRQRIRFPHGDYLAVSRRPVALIKFEPARLLSARVPSRSSGTEPGSAIVLQLLAGAFGIISSSQAEKEATEQSKPPQSPVIATVYK